VIDVIEKFIIIYNIKSYIIIQKKGVIKNDYDICTYYTIFNVWLNKIKNKIIITKPNKYKGVFKMGAIILGIILLAIFGGK